MHIINQLYTSNNLTIEWYGFKDKRNCIVHNLLLVLNAKLWQLRDIRYKGRRRVLQARPTVQKEMLTQAHLLHAWTHRGIYLELQLGTVIFTFPSFRFVGLCWTGEKHRKRCSYSGSQVSKLLWRSGYRGGFPGEGNVNGRFCCKEKRGDMEGIQMHQGLRWWALANQSPVCR